MTRGDRGCQARHPRGNVASTAPHLPATLLLGVRSWGQAPSVPQSGERKGGAGRGDAVRPQAELGRGPVAHCILVAPRGPSAPSAPAVPEGGLSVTSFNICKCPDVHLREP